MNVTANSEAGARYSCATWFIPSAAAILAVTGAAKAWTGLGHTKILAVADPITGIQFGHLMLAVGIVELVIASICLFSKSQKLKLGLIAWLATNFVVYRLGLWWMGWKKPCNCLGNLTDALHLSPQLADNIMKVILAYLLIGSYGLLIKQWQFNRRLPLIAVLILYGAQITNASEQQFHPFNVQGTLTVTSIQPDGNVFKKGSYGFHVDVSRTGWQLKAVYGLGHEQVYGYDGTNTYSYLSDPNIETLNVVPGMVAKGSYPPAATWHVTVPWLAYASRSYFQLGSSNEAILPAPWLAASHEPAAHIYKAHYPSLDVNYGIPDSIDFVVDHSLVDSAQTNELVYLWDRPVEMKQTPDVLKAVSTSGAIDATFRVVRNTNINGVNIPLEFDLVVYGLATKGGVKRTPQLQMHGSATSVLPSLTTSFVPETSKDVSITDFRFHNSKDGISSIKYLAQGGKWIVDEKADSLRDLFKKSAQREKAAMSNHRITEFAIRFVFYIVAGIVFLLPLLLMIRKWRVINKQKHTSRILS